MKLYYFVLKETVFKDKNTKWVVLITGMIIALVTVFYSMSDSISDAYIDAINGTVNYDCIVGNLSEEECSNFDSILSSSDYIGQICRSTQTVLLDIEDSNFTFEVTGLQGNWENLFGLEIVQGRAPLESGEIVIDQAAGDYLGRDIQLGDEITLGIYQTQADNVLKKDYTVTGFIDAYQSGSYELAGMVTFDEGVNLSKLQWGGTGYAVMVKAREETTDSIIGLLAELRNRYGFGDRVGVNENKLNLLDDRANNASGFLTAFKIIALMICTISFFTLYNIIHLSMSNKISKYGMLECLGLKKKQLWISLLNGLIVYIFLAFSVAALIFYLFEFFWGNLLVDKFLTSFHIVDGLKAGMHFESLLICTLCVTVIFGIAYMTFGIKISKLRPDRAVHYSEAEKYNKKGKKQAKIKSYIKFLGDRNLARNRFRTIYTGFVIFLLAVMVVVSFTVLINADLYNVDMLKKSNLYDLEWHYDSNDMSDYVTPDCIKQISDCDSINHVSWQRIHDFDLFLPDHINDNDNLIETHIYSDDLIQLLCEENGMDFSKTGEPYVFIHDLSNTNISSTETLNLVDMTGNAVNISVTAAITKDPYCDSGGNSGITLVMNEAAGYLYIGPLTYNHLLVSTRHTDNCKQEVDDILVRNGYKMYVSDLKDSMHDARDQLKSIVYMLLYLMICIGLMAITNIVCNININVNMRSRELEVMYALGMKNKKIIQLLTYEITNISQTAVFVAGIISAGISYFLVFTVNDNMNPVKLVGSVVMISVFFYILIYGICFCAGTAYYKNKSIMRDDD
ncbi:MAG: ABC transporter permease [Lachnospiraceae bacterium]|nr:ABC transporter permease [Lachnospiraceae bacterium]